jgi:hypothetical protein
VNFTAFETRFRFVAGDPIAGDQSQDENVWTRICLASAAGRTVLTAFARCPADRQVEYSAKLAGNDSRDIEEVLNDSSQGCRIALNHVNRVSVLSPASIPIAAFAVAQDPLSGVRNSWERREKLILEAIRRMRLWRARVIDGERHTKRHVLGDRRSSS